MERNNKFDQLFKHRFSDLEMNPGSEAWAVIEDRLARRRARRRAVFLRWTTSAAAAILLLYAGYLWDFQQHRSSAEDPGQYIPRIKSFNMVAEPNSAINSEDTKEYIEGKNSKTEDLHSTADMPLDQHQDGSFEPDPQADANTYAGYSIISGNLPDAVAEPAESTDISVPIQGSNPSTMDTSLPSEDFPTLTSAIIAEAASNKANPVSDGLQFLPVEDKVSRFRLGIALSPTMAFNSINIRDNTDVAAINAPNDRAAVSLAVGLELEYRAKGPWAFGAGLFINNWVQSNDRLLAVVASGSPTASQRNIYSNNSTANLQFDEGTTKEESFATADQGLLLVPELDETYTFLEVPLTATYYLFETRSWGLKLRGGLSPRFLTSSTVQLMYPDGSSQSVDNLPLRTFSLQLLVGTGVEYRLNSKFHLNLMPAIQYGLTPVNQHDVVSTYFHQFLIFSGLTYEL